MRINATALIASAAAPAFQYFSGADCTGSSIGTSLGSMPGQCISIANGGSAKSIGFLGVPNKISFFVSGGGHDHCTNGASLVLSGDGSDGNGGCATAPSGFDFESFSWS
ncbi:hypothetical protein K438DRAFT_1967920 [Mycena galopus ATCC 62051]|nr:hypothetical protein K438DRAFT_1967920 [Mycena galopus ATCC 62051]